MAAPVIAAIPIRPRGPAHRNSAFLPDSKIGHLSKNHYVHARLCARRCLSGGRGRSVASPAGTPQAGRLLETQKGPGPSPRPGPSRLCVSRAAAGPVRLLLPCGQRLDGGLAYFPEVRIDV